ncbi:MAG: ribosome biogenesis GTP-binding protein YihA/YsxC [Alphaproteobacteria bacterium]
MSTGPTRADKFFAGECDFAFGAATAAAMPPPHLPEFVFIGRSNAGKSSLLNALTGRKLAHVSTTPGRTQQLNFFRLERRCYLVDVPGYGFAKAPKVKAAAWQSLLRLYLRERRTLKRVFALIDSRHGITATDQEMLATLDRAAQLYQIVLTKTDLTPPEAQEKILEETRQKLTKHPAAYAELLSTSATRNTGMTGLRTVIFNLL